MARSWTDVANIALVEIGEEPIVAISDEGVIASLCNKFLPFAREEFLTEANWNFATKRAVLSPVAGVNPPFGYAYYFNKPSDWLRGYPISKNQPHYVIEADGILSNHSALSIKYIANITDPNAYTPWAAKAVALNLAGTIVSRIEKSDISKEGLLRQYQFALFKARRDDSKERPHYDLTPRVWHDARKRSSRFPVIRQEEV